MIQSLPYQFEPELFTNLCFTLLRNAIQPLILILSHRNCHAWSYTKGVKVPSASSLSVYTKVLAHNLNDIRNWASLIGLLFRICWCLLSIFLIYCSDEWKKLVNLIYCFQVLFRMNFKIMYFLMKILGNTPSADSATSRDSLSSQNAT